MERTGPVVGVLMVNESDHISLMTTDGMAMRIPAADVSTMSRYGSGTIAMRLKPGDSLALVARIQAASETT